MPTQISFIIIILFYFAAAGCAGGGSNSGDSKTNANPKITAAAGVNGSISPSGTVSVKYGADQSFAITADSNYHVLNVLVDGRSMGPIATYTFTNVTANHVIRANFDTEHQLVAMGDSITEGFGDDIAADDSSQDGKNNGGGFEPILNDLLTAYELGFPHDIVNEGVGGDISADAVAFIPTALGLYPHAKKYLLLYGTNDADIWLAVPSGRGLSPGDAGYPGTYKDHMQQIIDAINNAGKTACLAKIPIALGDGPFSMPFPDPDNAARNLLIKEYNQVIDELVNDPSNAITVQPPDFYNYFKDIDPFTGNPRYLDQYADNLHPNGLGYQSMANLWFDALTR
jgi:lysophospholipase L1-like esterase